MVPVARNIYPQVRASFRYLAVALAGALIAAVPMMVLLSSSWKEATEYKNLQDVRAERYGSNYAIVNVLVEPGRGGGLNTFVEEKFHGPAVCTIAEETISCRANNTVHVYLDKTQG